MFTVVLEVLSFLGLLAVKQFYFVQIHGHMSWDMLKEHGKGLG